MSDEAMQGMVERVFFRADGFYFISIVPGSEDEHARLNPGTIRIEDVEGDILWEPKQ